MVIGKITRIVG